MNSKKLILLIFLFFFQNLCNANDVKDIEVEGMSIGDTLLDYMGEQKIQKEINSEFSYHYDDYVSISTWILRDNFETYDDVGVILKKGDNNYTIYSLEGTLYMDKDSSIEDCYSQQNKINDDVKIYLNLNSNIEEWFTPKERLSDHHISIKNMQFELSGGVVRTTCYEIQKGIKKNSTRNLLYVSITSNTFYEYVNSLYQ